MDAVAVPLPVEEDLLQMLASHQTQLEELMNVVDQLTNTMRANQLLPVTATFLKAPRHVSLPEQYGGDPAADPTFF